MKPIVRAIERHERVLNWVLEPHAHYSDEILFVESGEGFVFTPNGHNHTLKVGTVLFIPSKLMHGSVVVRPTNFNVLYLYSVNLSPYCKFIYNFLFSKKKDSIQSLSLQESEILEYNEQFNRLEFEMVSNLEQKEEAIRINLEHFFLFLYRIYQKNNFTNPNENDISKVIILAGKEIEMNYREHIQIKDLAVRYYMSESYFRDKFKEFFSVSPKQHLMNIRLNEAKRELQRTNKSVTSISKEVGFSSVHQFNEYFLKREGMTPTSWRKIN